MRIKSLAQGENILMLRFEPAKTRNKLQKENNRNKRIDESLCIHMHTYTYKSTQRYTHIYMYLCVNQTKVINLDLFLLLLRYFVCIASVDSAVK